MSHIHLIKNIASTRPSLSIQPVSFPSNLPAAYANAVRDFYINHTPADLGYDTSKKEREEKYSGNFHVRYKDRDSLSTFLASRFGGNAADYLPPKNIFALDSAKLSDSSSLSEEERLNEAGYVTVSNFENWLNKR